VLVVDHSVDSVGLRRKTMRLCGQIGKLQVLILVDPCSVCTFISQQLAQQMSVPTSVCEPSQFIAADRSPMVCDKRIKHLQWS
jgi:hypothetical protein